jgi:hypothetical protein
MSVKSPAHVPTFRLAQHVVSGDVESLGKGRGMGVPGVLVS